MNRSGRKSFMPRIVYTCLISLLIVAIAIFTADILLVTYHLSKSSYHKESLDTTFTEISPAEPLRSHYFGFPLFGQVQAAITSTGDKCLVFSRSEPQSLPDLFPMLKLSYTEFSISGFDNLNCIDENSVNRFIGYFMYELFNPQLTIIVILFLSLFVCFIVVIWVFCDGWCGFGLNFWKKEKISLVQKDEQYIARSDE